MENSNQNLLKAIDAQFIEMVGPIGQLLIEDGRHLWRRRQWKGHSALRNYIKFLAQQIDVPKQKNTFIEQTSQFIMDSASGQNKASNN